MAGTNIPASATVVASKLKLNYEYKLSLMTAVTDGTGTFSELSRGFDNIAESINEVVSQFSFLSDEGWGSSYVTGGQLIFTLTGYRVKGDAAQDYLFSDDVYYGFGSKRESAIQIDTPDGTRISANVMLAKITRSGGASNTPVAISVEMHLNGKPTITSIPES